MAMTSGEKKRLIALEDQMDEVLIRLKAIEDWIKKAPTKPYRHLTGTGIVGS